MLSLDVETTSEAVAVPIPREIPADGGRDLVAAECSCRARKVLIGSWIPLWFLRLKSTTCYDRGGL
jgi:hypothetical protein